MRRNARTPRTSSTLIMLAVGLACGALVALDADDGSPNSGMADSVAPVDPSRGVAIDSTAATQRVARMPRVRAEDPSVFGRHKSGRRAIDDLPSSARGHRRN